MHLYLTLGITKRNKMLIENERIELRLCDGFLMIWGFFSLRTGLVDDDDNAEGGNILMKYIINTILYLF